MRLYMANVILNEAILPLTTADHTTSTKIDTRKRNASAKEGTDSEDNAKRWRQTHDEETGKRTIEKVGRASSGRRCRKLNSINGLNWTKTRIMRVTTRPTDIAAEGEMVSSVQEDDPYLSSEAIKLATTDPGTTGTNTLHRITARVWRPLEAIFSSL